MLLGTFGLYDSTFISLTIPIMQISLFIFISQMSNIIEFQNISKFYPGVIANDDISFSIEQQSIHAILVRMVLENLL